METFNLLRKYPQLLTKVTHVDCYKPWSLETYQYVAKKWLMNPQSSTDKVGLSEVNLNNELSITFHYSYFKTFEDV